MPASTVTQDCYEALDAALADELGARIKFGKEGDANQFRLRLHEARRKERERNKLVYDPGSELHGKSVYDALVVRVVPDEDGWFVYIERNSVKSEIEPLSKVVEEPTREEPDEFQRRA